MTRRNKFRLSIIIEHYNIYFKDVILIICGSEPQIIKITLHTFFSMKSFYLYQFSSDKDGSSINIYDGRGEKSPVKTLTIHSSTVTAIKVMVFVSYPNM